MDISERMVSRVPSAANSTRHSRRSFFRTDLEIPVDVGLVVVEGDVVVESAMVNVAVPSSYPELERQRLNRAGDGRTI